MSHPDALADLPPAHSSVDRPRLRRNRVVVGVAVVAGAVLIGATLRVQRGSAAFYVSGFGLAGVWFAAAIACGHVRWRSELTTPRREILLGSVLGAVMFGVFVGGAAIGKHIALLAGPINHVLGKADAGPVAAVLFLALVNGCAEELFFRGALFEVLGGRAKLLASLAIYVGVTAVAGNTALTLAAIIMGAVFVLERQRTGGVVTPIVTHLVWSTMIILLLPR